ncbi:Piga, partial [Symbiodinium pilosum]
LVRGPVPREELRLPLCLAFGALLHAMEPKQVASCIESLKGYCYKAHRGVFQAAYARLASSLEEQATGLGSERPWATLTSSEAAAAIKSFPELKFEDPQLLLRMLRALSPLQSHPRQLALSDSDEGSSQQWAKLATAAQDGVEAPSMLARMNMMELVDILEAFGQQGLIGCGAVSKAIVTRYQDNGGRLSRRNTARALQALAQLGEQETELQEVLIGELEGWEVRDPHGADLRPRPALVALWSLCALNLVPRAASSVDWLLTFLCRERVATYVLGIRSQALLLFESLDAVRSVVPALAVRHMQALQGSHSPVAEQVLLDVGQPLRSPKELFMLSDSPDERKMLISEAADEELLSGHVSAIDQTASDIHDGGGHDGGGHAGRSLLDELAIRWELARRKKETEGVSNAKQLVGSVLAALNLAPLLLTAPHPHGALAAETVRGSGGFEFRWPAGCYDLDWGLPFFRLGILVLSQRDFVLEASSGSVWPTSQLRAAPRLRVQQLREDGWWLVLLRSTAVHAWILPYREDPDLFNSKLQARVVRANALYPLETRPLKKKLRRSLRQEVHDPELKEQDQAQRRCFGESAVVADAY